MVSKDLGHKPAAAPLAASLAGFTEKLVADQGAAQSNTLFAGQIGAAAKALAARVNGLGVGDNAPQFSLPTASGGSWSLKDCLASNRFESLIVVFYRGSWCAYCNLYLRGLLEVQSQLSDAGAGLVAVSPEAEPLADDDPVHAYLQEGGSAPPAAEAMNFPVLVDHGGSVADTFGLTFEMDDGAKDVLTGVGLNLAARNADGRWTLPVPGTFVIDRAGRIAYAHVDADYRNRPEPQEIVALCRSLRR